MIKTIACFLISLFLFTVAVSAGQVEPPKLDPVPATDKQQATINEGVILHDKGDYDGAIRKYKEVLQENPDCVDALYEMSYSYFAKDDYKTALEIAMKGAKYNSRLLAGFYEQIGNALDSTGKTKEAIEYYKAGTEKLGKGKTLLYFNLALAYRNLGNTNEFKLNLKRSMVSIPEHSTTQLALGEYYNNAGYKTPAILALARFLVLEPKSSRSDSAYKKFKTLLGAGVTQEKDSNKINILVDTNSKTDEGDFGPMDMAIGLSRAASLIDDKKSKRPMEVFVSQMETLFGVLSETDSKEVKSSFVWNFYSPYFTEMKKRKFVEVFCYYISQKSDDPDVQKWLDDNQPKVNEFVTWSKAFLWPSVKP